MMEKENKMTNLLVELQTEELPPKALRKLSEAFAEGVRKSLADAHFLEDGSQTVAYGAPRRLAVHITNVRAKARTRHSVRSSFRSRSASAPTARPRPLF